MIEECIENTLEKGGMGEVEVLWTNLIGYSGVLLCFILGFLFFLEYGKEV